MTKLIEKDLVYRIIGCAMADHNEIGHGFREKTYERALGVEFKHQGLEYAQQSVFPVMYRGEKVDRYIPDLIVENKIIVDTKTVDSINNEHRGTILNYLRITNFQVGLIINYKHPKSEWERLVLDTAR